MGFGGQFGYYTDTETGLLCLTHRHYDPGTGKFINRDPIGYKGGINLYGFADGNPVNESDPSGDAPVGHHYVPQSIFRRANLPADVVRYFDGATTGPIPGGHNYTRHGIYNRAVRILWNKWIASGQVNPAQMTVAEAKEFVRIVRTSDNANIRNLLDGITYQFARAAAMRTGVNPQILRAINVVKPLRGIGVSFKGIPKIGGRFLGSFGLILSLGFIADDLRHRDYIGAIVDTGYAERTNPNRFNAIKGLLHH